MTEITTILLAAGILAATVRLTAWLAASAPAAGVVTDRNADPADHLDVTA